MLVKEILKQISKKEGVYDYTQIPLERWIEFQNTEITNLIDLDSNIIISKDNDFNNFFNFLNSIFISRVNRPTAIKIFNNAYYCI